VAVTGLVRMTVTGLVRMTVTGKTCLLAPRAQHVRHEEGRSAENYAERADERKTDDGHGHEQNDSEQRRVVFQSHGFLN
jgi:hypothetical protein